MSLCNNPKRMESDGQTYLLPHPVFARVIMTLAGAFAFVMAPYELWRGIWPLNITSPFFAFITLGGMSVGAAFLYGGLFASSAKLHFSPGQIEVHKRNPWGSSLQTIRTEDIASFTVEERDNSDGPNDWYAVIKLNSAQPITSRPLGTKEAADRQLAEFRTILRM